MKFALVFLFFAVILTTGCNNDQPKPVHPVTITAIPHEIVKVIGHWKQGPFTVGYRIVTEKYVIISEEAILFGQDGGPGMVPYATVTSFEPVVAAAKQAKDKEPMKFYGDLVYFRNGGGPYLYEGKQAIILFEAGCQGQSFEVNRRPWDN